MIIADNLTNSKRKTVERIIDIKTQKVIFYEIDVTNKISILRYFNPIGARERINW